MNPVQFDVPTLTSVGGYIYFYYPYMGIVPQCPQMKTANFHKDRVTAVAKFRRGGIALKCVYTQAKQIWMCTVIHQTNIKS